MAPPCKDVAVLVVDDDTVFREGLAEVLRDDGHPVVAYASPQELPPLDQLGNVSVVLTDYDTAGETGVELSDRFQAAHPDVPVIIVTAHWSHHLVRSVETRTGVRLSQKPLDYDELHALIHEVVG